MKNLWELLLTYLTERGSLIERLTRAVIVLLREKPVQSLVAVTLSATPAVFLVLSQNRLPQTGELAFVTFAGLTWAALFLYRCEK